MDSLNFQITHKDISLAKSKAKLATKSKEIKALQSKLKILEKNSSLAQMNLSEMDSLRLGLEQAKDNLSSKEYELEYLFSICTCYPMILFLFPYILFHIFLNLDPPLPILIQA